MTGSLTPAFKFTAITAPFVKLVDDVDSNTFDILSLVGEEFVNDARLNGSYMDHTGNLRASIGYVIYKDRKIVKEFIQKGTDQEGQQEASDIANNLEALIFLSGGSESLIKDGWALFVFAGMNYGIWVEAHGFDVLSAFAPNAARKLTGLIQERM